jgi:hypothetical protein
MPENAAKLAAAVLAELKLSKSQIDNMPVAALIDAAAAAAKKLNPGESAPLAGGGRGTAARISWGPIVDGRKHSGSPL